MNRFRNKRVLWTALSALAGGAALWALDQDGGGISDVWETHWLTGTLNATEDPDADGYNNLMEYYFNTNPLDPLSRPRIDIVSPEPIDIQVSFFAPMGLRFEIEQCDDLLTGNWTSLTGVQTGAGAPLVYSEDPTGMEMHFFRVVPHDAVDFDTDGLNAFEESLLGSSDNMTDSDEDSADDLLEFQEQTDPASAQSSPFPVWRSLIRSLDYHFDEIEDDPPYAVGTYCMENDFFYEEEVIDSHLPFPGLAALLAQTFAFLEPEDADDPLYNYPYPNLPTYAWSQTQHDGTWSGYVAGVSQARYWLHLSQSATREHHQKGLVITTRWIDGVEQTPVVQCYDLCIPLDAQDSQTLDLEPSLTQNFTATSNHTESVQVVLIPIDIAIRKQGEDVPKDGVLVKTGDVLEYALAPQFFNADDNLETLITWQQRQLKSDGNYTDWESIGPTATGSKFEHTTDEGGIFQIKAIVTNIGEYQYLRQQDAPHADNADGVYNENLRKGKHDHIGVVDAQWQIDVRNQAYAKLGQATWAQSATMTGAQIGFGVDVDYVAAAGSDKCNIFVFMQANAAGATVPTRVWWDVFPLPPTSRNVPPTADEWDDSGATATTWTWLPTATLPQPGYVVTRKHPILLTEHMGIVDYDGTWINAGLLKINKYIDFTNTYYQPVHFRKK